MRTSFNQYQIGGKCILTNKSGEQFKCTIKVNGLYALAFHTKDSNGKKCIISLELAINNGWNISPLNN